MSEATAYDVVVVGGGNAGYSAVHAAAEAGAKVLLLEKAPAEWAGGNSRFIAGFLFSFDSVEDLRAIADFTPEDDRSVISPYPNEQFRRDLMAASSGRSDPKLVDILVEQSRDAVRWLRSRGLTFRLNRERMAHKIDGRYVYWGGALVGPTDGGVSLMQQHAKAAEREGATILNATPATALRVADGLVCGVVAEHEGRRMEIDASAVILACGGFEASSALRAKYLGEPWRHVKVRGSPFNTGDGFALAGPVHAAHAGDWVGCHATGWACEAPEMGDLVLTNRHSRNFYVYGIVVNQDGVRFFDEGKDIRTHTYVEMGHSIAEQPGRLAYQIFDAKSIELLNPLEYSAPAHYLEGDSLEALAREAGLPVAPFLKTVADYNAAVRPGLFNPSKLDDCATAGIVPPKSHWARVIDTPPYRIYKLTTAITFTFGGLAIDTNMRVMSETGVPIEGLYAVGEMVGGLHYGKYAGGSGITFGVVSGRCAGRHAARRAAGRG